MPGSKPLTPDDFPLDAEGNKIVNRDGQTIGNTQSPATAEDIAERLNENENDRHEDSWSA